MQTEKKTTYAEAMKRLEEIAAKMEDNELDVDALAALLKEAKTLIAFCKEKLYAVDAQVREILADE